MNEKKEIQILKEGMERLRTERPLIHCITSPVAINDCANAVLAIGARVICAEHPEEVKGITEMSQALGVTLANITDARAASLLISGKAAKEKKIPSIIDAVGITCSDYRRKLYRSFVNECGPAVIKGNASEILEAVHMDEHVVESPAAGIDVSAEDEVHKDSASSMEKMAALTQAYARKSGAVIVTSGEVDVISDDHHTAFLANGRPEMADVTGTGCMLNCIIAACLAVLKPFDASVLGCALMGLAGEYAGKKAASKGIGLGSFHIALIDGLSLLASEEMEKGIRLHLS